MIDWLKDGWAMRMGSVVVSGGLVSEDFVEVDQERGTRATRFPTLREMMA